MLLMIGLAYGQIPVPGPIVGAGGGGGGSSTGAQLAAADYTPTRTSATVLTLPAIAANAMAVGGSYACPSAIASGATFTVSSGTGTLWVALSSDCTVRVRHNVVGSCSAGCTAVASASGFDPADKPLYEWVVTSGSLATTGTLKLTPYSSQALAAGANCSLATVNGVQTISCGGSFGPIEGTTSYLMDDFMSGNCGANQYHGTTQLRSFSNSGGDSVSCTSGVVANHPGVVRITTGATSGNDSALHSNQASTPIGGFFTLRFLVSLTSAANVELDLGFMDNTAGSDNNACKIEKASADTNWFFVCKNGGTQTRTDSGVAVAAEWRAFQVRRVDASTIGFRTATTLDGLTGAAETTITTNLPTANLSIVFRLGTTTTAAKSLDLDFFDLRHTGLAR